MKKLSIIIPVFNEEKTVKEVLQRVIQAPVLDYKKEIIVVDDGSTDRTKETLQELKQRIDFIFLEHLKNLGKGSAIKTALEKVTGDLVLIQDADLEYSPNDYQKLLEAFEHENAVIYGSRNIRPEKRGCFYCVLGVKFLTSLTNFLFNSRLTDIYTCYKLIPAPLLKSLELKSSRFEIDTEITVKLLKKRHKRTSALVFQTRAPYLFRNFKNSEIIKEVAISYFPRSYQEGKKIRIKDGLISIWTILKNRFF